MPKLAMRASEEYIESVKAMTGTDVDVDFYIGLYVLVEVLGAREYNMKLITEGELQELISAGEEIVFPFG